MELSVIRDIGLKAAKSRQARSEVMQDVKLEVTENFYSQRELQRLLKQTNKPIAMNTLKDHMIKMEEGGVSFNRTRSNQYLLTLEDLYLIGDSLGVKRYRDQNLPAMTIIAQNLKGGVGKSLGTSMVSEAVLFLDKYVMKQIRALIIDLDPQGTSTQQALPGYEISDSDLTSILAMANKDSTRESLKEFGIKKTSHKNLHILPCGTLDGFLADELDSESITGELHYAQLLEERIIKPLSNDYDFIFLDAGPHMDKVMKNCLVAANAIFIPTPPTFFNWDSTVRFIERIPDVMEKLTDEGVKFDKLKFIGAYVSKDAANKQSHDDDIYEGTTNEMYEIFGHQNVLKHSLPSEEAFERCTELSTTIFSMPKKNYPGSNQAYDRAKKSASDWAKEFIDTCMAHHK